MFDKKQIFSIRKFAVGVASVLLGFGIIGSTSVSVSATEVGKMIQAKQIETLDYNYLDYDELTESQKASLIKATPENVKQSDKVYYFVYKSVNNSHASLPKTGLSEDIGYFTAGLGLVVLALGLSKNKKSVAGAVIVLSLAGLTMTYPMEVLATTQELSQYNKQVMLGEKEMASPIIDIPGYTYYGYFVVDKTDKESLSHANERQENVKNTETVDEISKPSTETKPTVTPDQSIINSSELKPGKGDKESSHGTMTEEKPAQDKPIKELVNPVVPAVESVPEVKEPSETVIETAPIVDSVPEAPAIKEETESVPPVVNTEIVPSTDVIQPEVEPVLPPVTEDEGNILPPTTGIDPISEETSVPPTLPLLPEVESTTDTVQPLPEVDTTVTPMPEEIPNITPPVVTETIGELDSSVPSLPSTPEVSLPDVTVTENVGHEEEIPNTTSEQEPAISEIVEPKLEEKAIEQITPKVELKAVKNAFLYKLNDAKQFVRVLNLDKAPADLSKFKVKAVLEDSHKEIWLDVNAVISEGNNFKVSANFPELVTLDEKGLDNNSTYSILVKQKESLSDKEFDSFKALLEAIKVNPKGEFVIADHLSASEVQIDKSATSYISSDFQGTLRSKAGQLFSILDLKLPLFNKLEKATIENLRLENVLINLADRKEIGSLANQASESHITAVEATGNITGYDHVGGLVGVLDNNSKLNQSSFTGKVKSLHSVGGLVANATRGSHITDSFADVSITVKAIDEDRLGGLVGQVNQNATVERSYAKGSLENTGNKHAKVGGTIGAIYSVGTHDEGKIENVISFVKVTNGKDFIGNLNEISEAEKQMNHNKVVTDASTGDHISHKSLEKISNVSAEQKVKAYAKSLKLTPLLDNAKKESFEKVEGYKVSHRKAYDNMLKLQPFYDRVSLIKLANRLDANHEFNQKDIAYTQMLANQKPVRYFNKEYKAVNELKVTFKDGTTSTYQLTEPKAFGKTGIIDYKIDKTPLSFHPTKLAQELDDLLKGVVEKMQELQYNRELFNIQDQSQLSENEQEKLFGRLFLENHFINVKRDLEATLAGLVENSAIANFKNETLKTQLLERLNKESKEILVGLTYLDRWYNFQTVKEALLYDLDTFGAEKSSLDLVTTLGNESMSSLSGRSTEKAYAQIVSDYTNIPNLVAFIQDAYNRSKTARQSIDDWILSTSKASIVKTKSTYDKAPKVDIFKRLSGVNYQKMLLPLLTIKEENVYGIFTTNNTAFGIYDRYMKGITKESPNYNNQVQIVRELVDKHAKQIQAYFDTLYRVLNDRSRTKLFDAIIQVYDGVSSKQLSSKSDRIFWSKEYGSDAFDSVKAFMGPIGKWENYNHKSMAYAGLRDGIPHVYFSREHLLTDEGLSTLSHEFTHNLDNDVLFDGFKRRRSHGPESFALGLFETPLPDTNTLGINLIFDVKDKVENGLTHNSSPTRFQTIEDLETYMKGVFDVLYTMELAEAEVMKLQGEQFIKDNYKQIGKIRYNHYDVDNVGYVDSNLGTISSVNDLVDKNIVGGNITPKLYGVDNYIIVNMFDPYYGVMENNRGASGGLTFRRVAFELLAEKGYYDGMLPYISSKLFFEAKDKAQIEGVDNVHSDSYIIQQISGHQYKTMKDFRKAMFKKRDEVKNDIKPITIQTNVTPQNISKFDDIVTLFKNIAETNKNDSLKYRQALEKAKAKIFKAYFVETKEFRDSIYKTK